MVHFKITTVVKSTAVCLFIVCIILSDTHLTSAVDDEDNKEPEIKHTGPLPKDKILLKDVKTLTFLRHKRTTSRRTHSIHQLTCVGGTAGCKLFTPDVVECLNGGSDEAKKSINWKCHAEMSDRVFFNHVDIICEGYDYPEDDYILLGSCGLEFTLDYKDPHDHHEKSYFKHMDEHEKRLHQDRVEAEKQKSAKSAQSSAHRYWTWAMLAYQRVAENSVPLVIFLLLSLVCVVLVKIFAPSESGRGDSVKPAKTSAGPSRGGYSHFSAAILTSKKAC